MIYDKQIGKRIKFTREKEGIGIRISQRVKPWQEALIFVWTALWVTCGFFFVSQYIISEDEKQKIFIIVFLGFWFYLLIKAFQILLWRIAGTEEIIIEKDLFNYKRSYAGIGKKKTYTLSEIKNLGIIKYKEKSFKQSYENYFWSMGAETVGFNSKKRYMILGMQLDEKDAKLLSELIADGVRKFK